MVKSQNQSLIYELIKNNMYWFYFDLFLFFNDSNCWDFTLELLNHDVTTGQARTVESTTAIDLHWFTPQHLCTHIILHQRLFPTFSTSVTPLHLLTVTTDLQQTDLGGVTNTAKHFCLYLYSSLFPQWIFFCFMLNLLIFQTHPTSSHSHPWVYQNLWHQISLQHFYHSPNNTKVQEGHSGRRPTSARLFKKNWDYLFFPWIKKKTPHKYYTHPVSWTAVWVARLVPLQGDPSFPLQQQGAVQVGTAVVGTRRPRHQSGHWVVGDHVDQLHQRQGWQGWQDILQFGQQGGWSG